MNNTLIKEKRETAPPVPNGPVGAISSSFSEHAEVQTKNGIHKCLIRSHDITSAAILTKLEYWSKKSSKMNGNQWCFRSTKDLASDIGGISESTVYNHLQKLKQQGDLDIQPGKPKGSPNGRLNASSKYRIKPVITDLIKEASNDRSSSFVLYGLKDANDYGIGPALLLAHIEWDLARGCDARGCITTRKVVDYFGLKEKQQRTVQRWIFNLKEKGVLNEHKGVRPKRHLRFANGLDRLPVIVETTDTSQPETPRQTEQVYEEGLPACDPPVQDAASPLVTGLVMPHEPEELGTSLTDSEDEFRNTVQKNKASKTDLDELTVTAIETFLQPLDLETIVELGSRGPDGALTFFMEHCSLQTTLGAELFTLALQFRRRPWLSSSSPYLRRKAYKLSLALQNRLQEVQCRRAEQLKIESIPNVSDPDLPATDKRQLLMESLRHRNRVGIEASVSGQYEYLNPEVRKDYIKQVRLGSAAAEGFFRKHPEYSVAYILTMLDDCGKAPPPRKNTSIADPWLNHRKGTQLDFFFRNFNKIADE